MKNLITKHREFARKLGYNKYCTFNSDSTKTVILNKRIQESNQLKLADCSQIRDKLEFVTLDPSFDVEEFIKKFI